MGHQEMPTAGCLRRSGERLALCPPRRSLHRFGRHRHGLVYVVRTSARTADAHASPIRAAVWLARSIALNSSGWVDLATRRVIRKPPSIRHLSGGQPSKRSNSLRTLR